MNYCAGCGKELPLGSRFCPACGRVVQTATPTNNFDGIVRPRANRKIGGVCAGISRRYGWDLALVRLAAVLIALFTFPLGAILYVVMWAMLPEEPLLLPQAAVPGAGGAAGV